eukprot:sb/3464938/
MTMKEGYLVAGIILSFPLAFLYRVLIPRTSPAIKDLLLTLSGLALTLLCFGLTGLAHLSAMVLGSYLLTRVCGVNPTTCLVIFFSSMCHLLYGYITLSGVTYTITWTLVYCQALLKVNSYFMDILDNKGGEESAGFISYLGFVLYPTSLLVGPHFNFNRYVQIRTCSTIPDTLPAAGKKFILGICYIGGFYCIKVLFIPDDVLLSDEFVSYYLPLKLLYLTFWSKWLISKYLGVWAIAEACSLITGLGVERDGEGRVVGYNGVSSVHVWKFETSLTIQDELTSWNVQVHRWVKQYVYKRCKCLGNPAISRVVALGFLYFWHGIYFGFANLFLVEGLGVSSEEAISRYMSRDKMSRYIPRPAVVVGQYIVKNMCIGYGLCGFYLRSWERCHEFYSSVYYCFHWGLVLLLVVEAVVRRRAIRGTGKKEE